MNGKKLKYIYYKIITVVYKLVSLYRINSKKKSFLIGLQECMISVNNLQYHIRFKYFNKIKYDSSFNYGKIDLYY